MAVEVIRILELFIELLLIERFSELRIKSQKYNVQSFLNALEKTLEQNQIPNIFVRSIHYKDAELVFVVVLALKAQRENNISLE